MSEQKRSLLDRDKARAVLQDSVAGNSGNWADLMVDRLEACIHDPMWWHADVWRKQKRRADEAEAKLARIEKSCDIADSGALVAPGVLSTEIVRAILRGDQ